MSHQYASDESHHWRISDSFQVHVSHQKCAFSWEGILPFDFLAQDLVYTPQVSLCDPQQTQMALQYSQQPVTSSKLLPQIHIFR